MAYVIVIVTIVTIVIIIVFVILTLPGNPEHLASWGWFCRDEGQHGTNSGHPAKSGTAGNPTIKVVHICRSDVVDKLTFWQFLSQRNESLHSFLYIHTDVPANSCGNWKVSNQIGGADEQSQRAVLCEHKASLTVTTTVQGHNKVVNRPC